MFGVNQADGMASEAEDSAPLQEGIPLGGWSGIGLLGKL